MKIPHEACLAVSTTLHFLFTMHFGLFFMEAVQNYTVYTYVVVKKRFLPFKAVLGILLLVATGLATYVVLFVCCNFAFEVTSLLLMAPIL